MQFREIKNLAKAMDIAVVVYEVSTLLPNDENLI
jgi:hypothetical protein